MRAAFSALAMALVSVCVACASHPASSVEMTPSSAAPTMGADEGGPRTASDDAAKEVPQDGGGGRDAGSPGARTCDGTATLLPGDPGAKGPWPVGARTVQAAGLTTEVWYPAQPGSEEGAMRKSYDLREHLPDAEASKVRDADNPRQACDCFADLPLATDASPRPVIIFVHGTAGIRTQNLSQTTHWASRGFVVVAADHPNLTLHDTVGTFGPAALVLADPAGDVGRLLAVLDAPSDELAFLATHLDMKQLAFSGQSRGGSEFQRYADRGRVFIPMVSALATSTAGSALTSTLFLAGQDDTIASYSDQVTNYGKSVPTKRFIGIARAGHVSFTDMCALGSDQGGLLAIAKRAGVDVGAFVEGLSTDGCAEDQVAPERMHALINYASSAALEEVIACDGTMTDRLARIKETFAEVAEYQQEM